MNIFELLKDPYFRQELAQHIQVNVPELLECDPNNHIHDMVGFIEYNNPDRTGHTDESKKSRPHHFVLGLMDRAGKSISYQMLYDFTEDRNIDDMGEGAFIAQWGFKLGLGSKGGGWKYPNLGYKVRNIIVTFVRNKKLQKINAAK